jgi:large subunit ribosomal protein L23
MATKELYFDILRSPVITEKTTLFAEHNKYVFKVSMDANKIQIKKAIESIFSVKVKAINTNVTKGKVKRFRGKVGKRSDYKRAIITLEAGQTIEINTGV